MNEQQKLRIKKYHSSEKGKLALKRGYDKYKNTEKGKNARRKTLLKIEYGITQEQYDDFYIKQNGCCAICNKSQSELKRKLAVDHNHFTKEIRGLLCINCNCMIGYAKESTKTLMLGIIYLNKYN